MADSKPILSRRELLAMALAAGSASYLGIHVKQARAAPTGPWGDYPEALQKWQLPPAKRAKNVLELFIHGGLCPWETFYCIDDPAYGQIDKQMWWTFQSGVDSMSNWVKKNPEITGGMALQDFALDAKGKLVKFGAFADPLRQRTDITSRLRMHVMKHAIFPHTQARALAATGVDLGSPRIAGLGTSVGHYLLDHPTSATGSASYVIAEGPMILPFASLVGQHPTAAKPIELRVDGNPSALFTSVAAQPPLVHDVAGALRATYMARATVPGTKTHLRSAALTGLDTVDGQLKGLADLTQSLTPADFLSPGGVSLVGAFSHDLTATKLKLAAKLLTQPATATKYITVVDTSYGQNSSGFGIEAYDFHTTYIKRAVDKYPAMWKRLCAIINAPGEKNPAKLNLDETLIVINTDFGRSPVPQDSQNGRNHYPTAYTTLMFGGPVGAAQMGIVGAIDKFAQPFEALRPAETRAAVLVALGIYPFSKETFGFEEMDGVKTEAEAIAKITNKVLGVTL